MRARYPCPVSLYTILVEPVLERPVLVAGFDGWVNAGQAATGATQHLSGDGVVVARFDSDALFDYRDVRPTLLFSEGVPQGIDYPEVTLSWKRWAGQDLLVLTGPEPSLGWQSFSSDAAQLARAFGVVEHISLGGIPWAAPHTRPVSIITTASTPERMSDRAEHPEGLLTVPASATSAVEQAMIDAGIPTVGFWARVPNYIGSTFHGASLALVERVGEHLSVAIDASELAAEAAEQRVQIDAIAEGRSDIKTLVMRLEALVDEEPAVSGEQLASEIERFLRSQGDEIGE
jgi:hypothetical protein